MEEKRNGDLFKCLVYNGGVSLTLINGGVFCKEGLKRQGFHGKKADVFCSALLCAAFLSANLKEETGEISATIRTNGKISNLIVSGNAALCVRGCIDEADAENTGEREALFGTSGFLQVVRDDNYSRPFVGSCELTYEKAGGKEEDCGGFVAANFEEYFRVSEQLPTQFFVNVNTEKEEFYCGVLQALPGCETGWEEEAERLLCIATEEYKKTGDPESAAKKISGEISCVEKREIEYKCNCSREYLKGVLSSMGKDAVEELLEKDGKIEVHCHYCNTDYVFFRDDFEKKE